MSTAVKISNSSPAAQQQYAKPAPEGDGSHVKGKDSPVDVPYTEFQAENKFPYTAKYLGIENVWDEKDMGDDVQTIEDYMNELVTKGDIKNDVSIVEKKLKSLEKMANIDQLESNGQRLVKLATFIQYLKTLDRRQNERYI